MKFNAEEVLKNKREASLSYRSISFKAATHNLREEVGLKVAAALKTLAVGANLPQLFFEEVLLGPAPQTKVVVEASLLAEYVAARKSANAVFEADEWSNFESLKIIMKSKSALLLGLGRTFKVDMGLVHALGESAGAELLASQVLGVLPNEVEVRFPSLSQAGQDLTSIMHKKLFSFVAKSVQGPITVVSTTLGNLERGTTPNMDIFSGNEFLQEVYPLLPLFAEYLVEGVGEGDEKTPSVTPRGKQAVERRFQSLVAMRDAKNNISLDMVEPVQACKWLLPDAHVTTLGEIVTDIMNTNGCEDSAKRSQDQNSSSSATHKHESEIAEEEAAMDFFS